MKLGDMYPAILTIVLVGLVLGIGIYVLDTMRNNIATEFTNYDVNSNISTNNATTTLQNATADGYELISISTIINQSGDSVPTSNYSYTEAGVITWTQDYLDAFERVGDNYLNITSIYIWDVPSSAESAINDTSEGIDDFASWIAIIVLVIAAAIVLGIVLRSFGRKPGV